MPDMLASPGEGDSNYFVLKDGEADRLAGLIGKCQSLTSDARSRVLSDVLNVASIQSSNGFKTRTTVGVMLLGVQIDNMVVGGPAWDCQRLDRGDVILKVDGVEANQNNVSSLLVGSDIPGSNVVLTVQKGLANIVDVTLSRMPSEVIADRRRMFELFTQIKERATLDRDQHLGELVDVCIALWTKMTLNDAEHHRKVQDNVRYMQSDCDKLLEDLKANLNQLQPVLRRLREDELPRQKAPPLPEQAGVGLGLKQITSGSNEITYIVEYLLPGQPAQRCGRIFKNDRLLSVEGIPAANMPRSTLTSLISGPIGSQVVLSFARQVSTPGKDDTYEVKLVRGNADKNHEDASEAVSRLQDEMASLMNQMQLARQELAECSKQSDAYRLAAAKADDSLAEAERGKQSAERLLDQLHEAICGAGVRSGSVSDKSMNFRTAEGCQKARSLYKEIETAKELENTYLAEIERLQRAVEQMQSQVNAAQNNMMRFEAEKNEAVARQQVAQQENNEAQALARLATDQANQANEYADDVSRQNLGLRADLASILGAVPAMYQAVCRKPATQLLGSVGAKIDYNPAMGDGMSGPICIIEIMEGSPIAKSGQVSVGDVLETVEGRNVATMQIEDVRTLVLGPAGTRVTMCLRQAHSGNAYTLNVVRSGGGFDMSKVVDDLKIETCMTADAMHEELDSLRRELPSIKAMMKHESEALQRALKLNEEDYQTKLSAANSQIQALQEELERLRRDMGHGDAHLERLLAELRAREREVVDLTSRVSVLEARLRDVNAEMEVRVREANAELEAKKGELERAREEIKTLLKQVDAQLANNARLSEELAETKAEFDGLNKKIKSLEKELQLANMETARLTGDNKRLMGEIEDHPKQIADMKSKVEDMKIKMDSAVRQSEALTKENERERKANESLQSDLEREQKRRATVEDTLARAEADLAAQKAEVERLKNALKSQVESLKEQLKTEIATLTKALEASKAEFQAATDKLAQILDELEKERAKNTRLFADLAGERARGETLTVELAKALAKLKEVQYEYDASQALLSAERETSARMRKDADDERTSKSVLQKDLASAKVESDRLVKELEAMTSKYTAARDNGDKLDKELSAALEQVQVHDTKIKKLESDNAALTSSEADNKARITSLTLDLKRSSDALKALEQAHSALEKDMETRREELVAASHREADKDEAIGRLTVELTKLSKVFADLKQQFEATSERADASKKVADAALAEHVVLASTLASTLTSTRKMRDAVCGGDSTAVQGGVGMDVEQDGSAFIVKKGTLTAPAKFKVAAGDAVLSIDGTDLKGMSVEDVRRALAGPVASPVTILAKQGTTGHRYMVTMVRTTGKIDDPVRAIEKDACETSLALLEDLDSLRSEIGRLKPKMKEEVEGLQRALGTHKEETESKMTAAEREMKELKDEVVRLRKQLSECEGDRDSARNQLKTRSSELTGERDRAQELAKELADIKSQLATSAAKCEKLASDLEIEAQRTALLTQEKSTLTGEVNQERARGKDLAKELTTTKSEVDKLNAECERLRLELARAREDIKEADAEHKRLAGELATEKAALAKARLEMAQLVADVEKAAKRMAGLDKECADAKAEIARLKTEIEKLNKELTAKSNELNKVTGDLQAEKSKSEQLGADKSAVQAQLDKEKALSASLEKNLEAAKTEIADLKRQIEQLKKDVEASKEALNAANAEHQLTKKTLDAERDTLKNLTADHAQERARKEELTVDLVNAEARIQALEREVDALKAQVKTEKDAQEHTKDLLNREIERLAQDLAAKHTELKDARSEAGSLKKNLESEQANCSGLNQVIDKLKADIKDEQSRVKTLQREVTSANTEVERLNGDNRRLLKEIENHPKEKAEAQAKVDAAVRDKDAANTALEGERKLVEKLRKDIEQLNGLLQKERQNGADLRDQVTQLTADMENETEAKELAEGDAADAWKRVAMLEKQVEELKNELAMMNATKVLMARVSGEQSAALHDVAEVKSAFVTHKAKTLKDLGALEERIKSLQASERDAVSESASLKKLLESARADKASETRKLEAALKREAEQAGVVLGLHSEIEKLNMQLQGLRKQLDSAHARAENNRKEADVAHAEHVVVAKDLASAVGAARKMHEAVIPPEGPAPQGGVGVQIAEHDNGEISVVNVLAGGSAKKNGKVASGDRLLSVNGKSVTGMSADAVRSLVVGPLGTPVTLAAIRDKEKYQYMVTLPRTTGKDDDVIAGMEKDTCQTAKSMHAELDSMRTEISKLLPKVKEEVEGLQRSVEGHREVSETRMKDLGHVRNLLATRDKELEKALADLTQRDAELAALKEKLQALTQELADTKTMLANVTADGKKLKALLETEMRETAQLREDVSRAQSDMVGERTKRQALKKDVDALTAELDKLKKEHAAEIGVMVKDHAIKTDAMRVDKEKMVKAQLKELEAMRADYLKEIEAHKASLERLRKEHMNEVERLTNDHLKEIERISKDRAKEVDALNKKHAAELDAERANVKALNEALAKAKAEITKLNAEVVPKLERGLADETKKVQEGVSREAGLNKEVAALKDEIDQLKKRLPDVEELAALRAKLAALTAACEAARKEAEAAAKAVTLARDSEEMAQACAREYSASLAKALADVQKLCNAIKALGGSIPPSLHGVGMRLERTVDIDRPGSGPVVIKMLQQGGPAAVCGKIKEGDYLRAVDGQIVEGVILEKVQDLILGEAGTEVIIRAQRDTQAPYNVTLFRDGAVTDADEVNGAVATTQNASKMIDALRAEIKVLEKGLAEYEATEHDRRLRSTFV